MDNLCLLAQGGSSQQQQAGKYLFHAIDVIFCANNAYDVGMAGKEPNLVKKLRHGDTFWTTQKLILGWLPGTRDITLSLPISHFHKVLAQLTAIWLHIRCISNQCWWYLLGSHCSIVLAILSGIGLFSHLQATLPIDAHSLGNH